MARFLLLMTGLIKKAEAEHLGKRAEISEMFQGKKCLLFIYIPERRPPGLCPPRGIGNFGGETDNWMWPRHTGDFSFMRAYAAPDGSPADAVLMSLFASVEGLLAKWTGEKPFDAPVDLLDLIRKKEFGQFAHPGTGNVPVGLLYSLDTTGGNSGSPVFNATGEIIGLNFDRTFEATINDYGWDHAYSRSIGVDIRYILWILKYYAKADYLLDEIGI